MILELIQKYGTMYQTFGMQLIKFYAYSNKLDNLA